MVGFLFSNVLLSRETMKQHSDHIKQLLEKYVNNIASPDEVRELIAYIDTDELTLGSLIESQLRETVIDEAELNSYTKDLLSERLDRIRSAIRETSITEFPARQRWFSNPAIAVAVVVLFCLSIAGYYIHTHVKGHHAVPVEGEILAGGNRAWLILADGSEVELDNSKRGIVVGEHITYDDGTLLQTGRVDQAEAVLPERVTLVTPRGGQYQAALPDGTRVWLNANSSLTYPLRFVGDTREVTLVGEAYFDVSPDHERPFRVMLNDTEIEVLGTQFNAKGYGTVTTTLIEGSVKVIHDNEQRLLQPGEEAEVRQNINVYPADIQKAVAWKNGFFYFKDDKITEILDQVSRWYDVDINYQQDSMLPREGYHGKIRRTANLSEVLEMLNYISGADFDIKGREVTVTF